MSHHIPRACNRQTTANKPRFLSKSLCFFFYWEQGERSPLLQHQRLKGEQHKMFPMHITTIPRPISRILFALIASYAFCPCRTSWNVLVLKTCKGSTPMLQMTSCIVLQWTLFFSTKVIVDTITFAVITAHIARAKAIILPAAHLHWQEQERYRGPEIQFTLCPTLGPLGAQISIKCLLTPSAEHW